MTFRTLLRRLKRHYPSTRAFAEALGVDASHLSRAMGVKGQPFDVRGCLRLARVTGASPGEVLRAAGKIDIAELIEALYGAPAQQLTPEQQQLLAALDGITDPAVRQSLITVARSAAGAAGGSSSGGGDLPGSGGLTGGPPVGPGRYKMNDDDFGTRRARTVGR